MKRIIFLLIALFSVTLLLTSCNIIEPDEVEHTHQYGYWTVYKEATCTDDGIEDRYCSCNARETRPIPAKGHNVVVIVGIEPTCLTSGSSEGRYCCDCGKIFEPQVTIPAIDHSYDNDFDLTCNNCYEVRVCNHRHTEIIPEVPASCTAGGYTEGLKCQVCGAIITPQEYMPPRGHDIAFREAVNPTCVSTGMTEGKYCIHCNTVFVQQTVIPMLAHSYTNASDLICNNCGYTRTCYHTSVQSLAAVEPNCTSAGLTEGKKCLLCNEILQAQTMISPYGHNEITLNGVEATCTDYGLTEGKQCLTCGKQTVEQTIIPAKGHKVITIPRVNPTCTTDGMTAGSYCDECGVVLQEQIVLNARGHIESTISNGSNPTCTNDGYTETKQCMRCQEITQEKTVIPATGHTEVVIEGYDSTCSSDGLTDGVKCSACNQILVQQEKIPWGHKMQDGYCILCGEGESTPIDYFTISNRQDGTVALYLSDSSNVPANIIVPKTYKGRQVKMISFSDADGLKSIVLPEGIESINLYRCINLEKFNIPSTTKDMTISDNNKIEKLVISQSIKELSLSVYRCSALTEVALPYSMRSLNMTLYACEAVTDVDLPSGLNEISVSYKNCPKVKSLIIPDGASGKIGFYAFEGCTGLETVIIGDSITAIDQCAFHYCENISKLVIGDGVTTIGEGAFIGCSNITELVIGGGVKEWDESAVFRNRKLKSVVIHEGVTAIPDEAFSNCKELEKVVLPDSLLTIGNNAFSGDISLHDITIGNNLTYIGDSAFENCSFAEFDIPDSVKYIGERAFYSVGTLYALVIPTGVETIGANIIGDTNSYIYCVGSSAKSGWNSQWNSGKTVSYNVRDTGITDGLYWVLHNDGRIRIIGVNSLLEVVRIPETINGYPVAIMNNYLFEYTHVRELYLPANLVTIGQGIIFNATNLEKITIASGNPKYHSDGNCIIETATNTLYAGCNSSVIPDYVTAIGDYAFSWCDDLGNIYLPKNITKIGYAGFVSLNNQIFCEAESKPAGWNNEWAVAHGGFPGEIHWGIGNGNITADGIVWKANSVIGYLGTSGKVTIPAEINGNKITEIAKYAFYGNDTISEVIISEGITTIGKNAFAYCSNIQKMVIPSSVNKISGEDAYGTGLNCEVEHMYLPALDVYLKKNYGLDIFSGVSNVYFDGVLATKVTIPNNITSIPDYAFSNCRTITEVVIHDNVTHIGYQAFRGCSNLASVRLCTGLEKIGEFAFNSCALLESINIPDGVTEIGRYAFAGCGLTEIILPDSVIAVRDNAFRGCNNVESITIGSGLATIEDSALRNMASLKNITVSAANSYFKAVDNVLYSKDGKTLIRYAPNTSKRVYIFPDSVTNLESDAFCDAIYIEEMVINASVYLHGIDLSDCVNISNFVVDANNKHLQAIDGNLYSKDGQILYRYAPGKKDSVFIVPEHVYKIDSYAFVDADNLVKCLMYDNVEYVMSDAFTGCDRLTEVVLSNSIYNLYSDVFKDCVSLESIVLPNKLTDIGLSAFEGCISLKEIYIPYTVTSISAHAFAGCTSLTNITGQTGGWCYEGKITSGAKCYFALTAENVVKYSDFYWKF